MPKGTAAKAALKHGWSSRFSQIRKKVAKTCFLQYRWGYFERERKPNKVSGGKEAHFVLQKLPGFVHNNARRDFTGAKTYDQSRKCENPGK